MLVTFDVSQLPMPPVKDVAPRNMSATAERANDDATQVAVRRQQRSATHIGKRAPHTRRKQTSATLSTTPRGSVRCMLVTCDVSQLPMPPVKDVAPSNMSATAERANGDATQAVVSSANSARH